MEKSKYEFLQYLYKTLKKHDKEILKHFCEESVSDNDYFYYGINSDIISNTLNIVINYLSGNIESCGVDASCRTIIESLVILLMDAKGKISDTQKTIYRYLYAYVDLDNFQSVLNEEDMQDEHMKIVFADKEKAELAMLNHFKCSKKDLKKRKFDINDPCFYLKENLDDEIRFAKLLKIYPIGDVNSIKMYDFFSVFIHPRCEMNNQIEEALLQLRNIYIDGLLKIVYEYLKSCKLLINKEEEAKTSDFNADFFYNPLLINNVNNVKDIEYIFNFLIDNLCKLKNGVDWFTWHFLEKSKYLVIDMLISESFGYKEHVISIFKSFIEEFSVLYKINSLSDMKEFNYRKRAFWCSSRLQLGCHFENLGIEGQSVEIEDIRELYDGFFKEKYELDNFDCFLDNLKRNSLYSLDKDNKNYNKHVKELIMNMFEHDFESKDVMTLYKISKDMNHGSGYNFNASPGVVDVSFHKVLLYTYKILIDFIVHASLTLIEHHEECHTNVAIEVFKAFMNVEENALKEVIESYK